MTYIIPPLIGSSFGNIYKKHNVILQNPIETFKSFKNNSTFNDIGIIALSTTVPIAATGVLGLTGTPAVILHGISGFTLSYSLTKKPEKSKDNNSSQSASNFIPNKEQISNPENNQNPLPEPHQKAIIPPPVIQEKLSINLNQETELNPAPPKPEQTRKEQLLSRRIKYAKKLVVASRQLPKSILTPNTENNQTPIPVQYQNQYKHQN